MKKLVYAISMLVASATIAQNITFPLVWKSKSDNDITQVLKHEDSIISNPLNKHILLNQQQDKEEAMLQLLSKSQSVASQCNSDSSYHYTWSSNWSLKDKSFYSYDANNNRILELSKRWNGLAWVNSAQYIYTFDANNNVTNLIIQMWNGSASSFVNYMQAIYTFNANNILLGYLTQQWNGTIWINYEQVTMTLDANNNYTSTLDQYWNTTSTAWVNNEQQAYTFDANNNETSDLQQRWDTTNTVWVNTFFNKYTNDANHNRLSDTAQVWNTTSTAWVNQSKSTYTYDVNNNKLSKLTQPWNGTAWGGVTDQEIYTYDANNNETNDLNQHWNGTIWVDGEQDIYTYDSNSNKTDYVHKTYNIVNSDSTHYYFPCISTAIKEVNNGFSDLTIYPNPSNGVIQIKSGASVISGIEISNLIGEKIYTSVINFNKAEIDISKQAAGAYFIQITSTDKTIAIKKIILQ